jgi:hypothetical protein
MSDENAEQVEEPTRKVINLNINDAHIAKAKEEFKHIDAYADLGAAKKAKKFLTKMRTTLGEYHKREKKQILIDGRRLDGEKNRLLALIAEVEDPISTQLTEIKEKADREEADRVEKIENEIERIRAFANDRHDLTLGELNERRATLALIAIDEEFFQEQTELAQTFKDEAEAKLRIAVVNEQERVTAKAAQDKIAADNAAKAKELQDRQDKMDAEEAERKAAQKVIDDAAAKKLAEENAEKQVEFDRVAKEQEAERKRLDQEREEREQAERDKEAEELQAREEAENEAALLAAAPDVEKLEAWADELRGMRPPILATNAAQRVSVLAKEKVDAAITYISNEVEKMK